MKNAKIVLVAEWDGWCSACGGDRPLVLTRTGRQRLRTWLTGAADDSRPLVLTCRLCGTGVDVPLERDDPPVTVTTEADERPTEPAPVSGAAAEVVPAPAAPPAVPAVAPDSTARSTADPTAELIAGRQAVAQALGTLLQQRSAAATVAAAASQVPSVAPVAPLLPLQRAASNGGLAELQLLADGIDLLSAGRP